MAPRRRLHVAVRLRRAEFDSDESCVEFQSPNAVTLHDTTLPGGGFRRAFHVDSYIDATMSTAAVFETLCRPSIDRAIALSAPDTLCFLAYGHTNSGKTHTIAGSSPAQPGLLTLCAEHLLKKFDAMEVTALEVYAEVVHDLLAGRQLRRVRRVSRKCTSRGGPAVVVEDLTVRAVLNESDWEAVAAESLHQRRTAEMELNHRSSRSHAIFTLKAPSGLKVCLVDLAGSERQSILSKQLNRESIAINKSLSRLSTVIQALSRSRPAPEADTKGASAYVNFRDTTLTVLLQRYLSGSALTTFIACVHPAATFFSETLSTLRYTTQLLRITTGDVPSNGATQFSRANSLEFARSAALNDRLTAELATLRQQLADSSACSQKMEEAHRKRIQELEAAHHQLQLQLTQFQRTSSNVSPIDGCGTYLSEYVAAPQHALGSSCSALGSNADLASESRRYHSGSDARVDLYSSQKSRGTTRVAGWLLSRCISRLPTFNVSFDDYFHNVLPPQLTTIGYVSCMACLLPRDDNLDDSSSVRMGLLDTGDLVMGLTMLDAGIPPFVMLHSTACRRYTRWEHCNLGAPGHKVFVVAAFDVPSTQVDSLCMHEDDLLQCEGSSNLSCATDDTEGVVDRCCDQFSSFESLVPFAIVLAVEAIAPLEHHQAVYEHLATLAQQQDSVGESVDTFAVVVAGEVASAPAASAPIVGGACCSAQTEAGVDHDLLPDVAVPTVLRTLWGDVSGAEVLDDGSLCNPKKSPSVMNDAGSSPWHRGIESREPLAEWNASLSASPPVSRSATKERQSPAVQTQASWTTTDGRVVDVAADEEVLVPHPLTAATAGKLAELELLTTEADRRWAIQKSRSTWRTSDSGDESRWPSTNRERVDESSDDDDDDVDAHEDTDMLELVLSQIRPKVATAVTTTLTARKTPELTDEMAAVQVSALTEADEARSPGIRAAYSVVSAAQWDDEQLHRESPTAAAGLLPLGGALWWEQRIAAATASAVAVDGPGKHAPAEVEPIIIVEHQSSNHTERASPLPPNPRPTTSDELRQCLSPTESGRTFAGHASLPLFSRSASPLPHPTAAPTTASAARVVSHSNSELRFVSQSPHRALRDSVAELPCATDRPSSGTATPAVPRRDALPAGPETIRISVSPLVLREQTVLRRSVDEPSVGPVSRATSIESSTGAQESPTITRGPSCASRKQNSAGEQGGDSRFVDTAIPVFSGQRALNKGSKKKAQLGAEEDISAIPLRGAKQPQRRGTDDDDVPSSDVVCKACSVM